MPVHADRDGALRYAWLRAPPLRPIPEIPQTFATLTQSPNEGGQSPTGSAFGRPDGRLRVPTVW